MMERLISLIQVIIETIAVLPTTQTLLYDNVAYTFQRSSSSHPLRIVTQVDCTTDGTDDCADGSRSNTVLPSSLSGWTDVTSSSSTTFTFTSTGTYYYVYSRVTQQWL